DRLDAGALYVRPDGVAVGTGAELLAGKLQTGIWVTGAGSYSAEPVVFTGSDAPPQHRAPHSSGDSPDRAAGDAAIGAPAVSTGWWNVNLLLPCATATPIYCVEP